MGMVFCRGCAKQIHESALTCPGCGAAQAVVALAAQPDSRGSPWVAIVSLVLGIASALMLFDDSEWGHEEILGLGIFSFAGLVSGIISINKKKPGNGMAITGVVLSAIALMVSLGLSLD